jgi:hypothetical protein
MGKWAGLAIVLLGFLAIVKAMRGEKDTPPVLPGIMPAFGACPACEQMVPVTTRGGCSQCGNKDVVIPYSDGARLTLRDNAAKALAADRRRFRRGGQTA